MNICAHKKCKTCNGLGTFGSNIKFINYYYFSKFPPDALVWELGGFTCTPLKTKF